MRFLGISDVIMTFSTSYLKLCPRATAGCLCYTRLRIEGWEGEARFPDDMMRHGPNLECWNVEILDGWEVCLWLANSIYPRSRMHYNGNRESSKSAPGPCGFPGCASGHLMCKSTLGPIP